MFSALVLRLVLLNTANTEHCEHVATLQSAVAGLACADADGIA